MSISYQPWALIPDTADPQAVEDSIARVQKRRRPDTPARRESDRRWAEKRSAQRRAAKTGESLPADPHDDPMRDALHHTIQERLAAYQAGRALHPLTGEYVHESDLPDARRGALIAWRKGYRITSDGRVWNPIGIELFSGATMKIIAGHKHHRRRLDPTQRTPQHLLAFCPYVLAALCCFGLRALHDGWCVVSLDGNRQNLRHANLRLRQRSAIAHLRERNKGRARDPYRTPTVATVRDDGRRKKGTKLTPEQAQAIRQLLDCGWTPKRIVAQLAERGVSLSVRTINAVNIGAMWA